MNHPRIVIWGASYQAMVTADILRKVGKYELVGFLDDLNPERKGENFYDGQVLGGREEIPGLSKSGVEYLIFGFGHTPARLGLTDFVREQGFQFGTAVHPLAAIAGGVAIGAGSVIKAGVMVDPNVTIGEQVQLGANTVIAHGSRLDEGVRVSGGSVLGASVHLQRGVMIGIDASVRAHVTVGAGALIGQGTVVLEDVPAGMVVTGVPARILRAVRPDDFA